MPDHADDDEAVARFTRLYQENLGRLAKVFHVPEIDATDGPATPTHPHIDVFVFRPALVTILATAGMSSRAQDSAAHPRVELYLRLPAGASDDDVSAACRQLWHIARFPFSPARPVLAPWSMLHTSLPPLTPTSRLSAVVLTPALRDDRPVHRLARALGVELLHAYGLTDAERIHAESWGLSEREAFVRAMMRVTGKLTDPARGEVDPKSILS